MQVNNGFYQWGRCGITAEFCTESGSESGAPGTAAAGENGCICNCGTDIVTSDAPETYRQVAYFEGLRDRLDTTKDITYAAVDTWVNIAKDSNAGDYGWDEDDEMAFKSYMGSIWRGWKNWTELASRVLFNGSESTVTLLTKMIKDGKLIEGSSAGNEGEEEMGAADQRAYIAKSFYVYVIPQVWQRSGQNVFVVDTDGLECDDESNPVSDYLDDSIAETA
ncbi:hypothetical protein BDW69DRAFT_190731 [Aspergillus filifer]